MDETPSPDRRRLEEAFARGTLLHPNGGDGSIADLSRVLARHAGVPADGPASPGQERIERWIGSADVLVFALIDGLGMHLVDRTPADGFLRENLAGELRTVFPSSTAPSLTTLATGLWPGRHGITAWWTHLPRRNLTATVLPYAERFSGRPLDDGEAIPAREIFLHPSLVASATREIRAFLPQKLVGTVSSEYLYGGKPATGYESFDGGIEALRQAVREARGPASFYFYFSGVDSLSHERGPDDPEVLAEAGRVAAGLERVAESLRGRGRLVVSADHGSIRVPSGKRHLLAPDHPWMRWFDAPPSGEPRVLYFHARPGAEEPFESDFRSRWGDAFVLLRRAEAEAMGLFGPGPSDPETRARMGSHVATPLGGDMMLYGPPVHHAAEAKMNGHHGGLMPDEMRIPVIVA